MFRMGDIYGDRLESERPVHSVRQHFERVSAFIFVALYNRPVKGRNTLPHIS